jgi:hypothetical protein
MSKMVSPNKKELVEQERFGRKATQQQIKHAEMIANRLSIDPPIHLYSHHISLCGWIWAHMSKNING